MIHHLLKDQLYGLGIDDELTPPDASTWSRLLTLISQTYRENDEHLLYRTLFDQTNDAVFLLDSAGVHITANKRAALMLGYDLDELVSLSYRDLVIPEEHKHSDAVRDRLLAGQVISPYERHFRKKDGTIFPVEINTELLRDSDGQPMCIQSVVRDITERKKAEADLLQSQQRYRLLINHIPHVSVILFDHDLRYLLAEGQLLGRHGYSKDDMIGKTMWEVLPEDLLALYLPPHQAVLQGQESHFEVDLEGFIYTSDFIPVQDENGAIVAGMIVIQDITQHRQAEAALRFQAALVEQTNDAVISTDLQYNVITWNPAAERIYGWAAGEAIGRYLGDVVGAKLEVEKRGQAVQLLQQVGQLESEVEHTTKEGTVIHVLASTSLLRNSAGEPAGFITILHNITERKEAEAAIRFQAALVDHMDDAVYSTDLDENILTWNPAAERTYGWSAAEAIGQFSGKMVGSNLTVEQRTTAVRQLREQGHWQGEITHTHRSGRLIDAWVSTTLLTDANGQSMGFIAISRNITTRKQMEEASRYQATLLNQINDAVYSTDLDEKVMTWNRAAERLYGWTKEEAMGQPITKMIGSRVTPEQRQSIITSLQGTGHWQGELLHTSRAGLPINTLVSMAMVRDQEGKTEGLIAVSHDITERKQQQEALRQQEEQYRVLYTAAERQARELTLLHEVRSVMAREMELDTLIPAIVQAISSIFGYTHVSLYLLENDRLRLQYQVGYDQVIDEVPINTGVLGRVVRTGQPIFVEDVTADPDFLGAVPGIRAEIAVPIVDRGEVIGAFNIESMTDGQLTQADLGLMIALGVQLSVAIQRARLFDSLRDSEMRLRLIGESISDIIFQTDREGIIEYVSSSLYNLLGYQAADWIGSRPSTYVKFIHPDDLPMFLGSFEGDILINKALRQEYRVRHMDGHYVDMEAISNPLADGDGRVTGRLAIVRDVTERKLAAQHATELAAQVKLVESLRRFLTNVSHDLRTPLSIMTTNLYLMRRKLGETLPYTHYLDVLDKQVAHLAQMVDDLMEVSRLEDRMVEFEFIAVRLGDLMRDVLVGQKGALAAKHHTLSTDIHPDVPVIQADQAWMGRVVRNLVANAIQFTSDGGQITARVKPQDGGVLLEVADTGAGIAPEHLAHIFDRFYRADEARPSDKGGAGLGLTIVQKVVEAHHGWVDVQSTVGEGSVFRVWLPAGKASAE